MAMQATDQTIRDYILSAIDAGTYPAGSRLPTERALSSTLSVGRGAVRNALRVLEGEGRIIRVAGSGTYVAATETASPSLGEVTSPIQVMDARLAFEPTLARLIAANGTAADFEKMKRCIASGGAAETIEQFEHWDAAFHETVAMATKNPVMIAAYRLVTEARNTAEWGALKRRTLTETARASYHADHEKILDALRQRDAEAAEEAIRNHLVAIRNAMLGP
ncbi:FCD domain-containing protein [Acuticoccus sp. M5D2P5]|uniref:FadR/GntR family transcriptional regulator n=1 Tax=Acuticoccus kalidii TaxID=2910977 RepID=UPI001F35B52F|nr:FCD domain-containing protein [Acuticoccus kalidii]MCF3934912.1 FCD domain-containing protein [Acuticoccus kalidii]